MRLAFDIETDGIAASRVHSLCIKDVDTGATWSCADQPGHTSLRSGLELLVTAEQLIGHNILSYDIPTLMRLYPDFAPRGTIRDTLIIARIIWTDENLENQDHRRREKGIYFPPTLIGKHKLEAWGYRLGVRKGEFNTPTTDWSAWTPQMQAYCGQDVEVTDALWKLIEKQQPSEKAIDLEQEFRVLIDAQEKTGFPFDKQAAAALYAELVALRSRLTEQLQATIPAKRIEQKTPEYYYITINGEQQRFPTKKAFNDWYRKNKFNVLFLSQQSELQTGPNKFKLIPFNPGSAQQCIAYFETKGWSPTHYTDKGNPQFDEEVIKRINLPEARPLLDWLLVNKRIGQVAEGNKAWLKLEKEGRMHGRVLTTGTVTVRCTHSDPNITQVPQVKIGKDKQPIRGFDGGYGWECRSCFTAEKDMVLVGWDASGLELRCLSHYMARYDEGAYGKIVCDPNGDIHTVNQKAAGIDTRAQAKTWIYAYLYGAGDELLGENAGGVTAEQAAQYRDTQKWLWGQYVSRFHRANRRPDLIAIGNCIKGALLRKQFEKGLPALGSLKEAIKSAVQTKGYLLALDGRKLVLRSSHSALNFLLQSAGSILVKTATVLLWRRLKEMGWTHGNEWAQHAHVHDEVQASVRPALAELYGQTAVQCIREAGESFNFRIPLSGEFKIGRNWAETH